MLAFSWNSSSPSALIHSTEVGLIPSGTGVVRVRIDAARAEHIVVVQYNRDGRQGLKIVADRGRVFPAKQVVGTDDVRIQPVVRVVTAPHAGKSGRYGRRKRLRDHIVNKYVGLCVHVRRHQVGAKRSARTAVVLLIVIGAL